MVIISGGCGGVGSVIGKKLADDGFEIVALYHKTPRKTAEDVVRGFGGRKRHKAVACDLRDEHAVNAVIDAIVADGGTIDACIHAAVGPALRKNILEMSDGELREELSVSFFGGFYFLKAAAARMKGKSGAIVGILSRVVEPEVRYARMAGITIGKYALRGLLKELHGELLPSPVTVNAIAPDFMDTPLNKDLPSEVRKFIAERAVRGSIRSPQDVARAVSYLCSDEGRATNGMIFSFEKNEMHPL